VANRQLELRRGALRILHQNRDVGISSGLSATRLDEAAPDPDPDHLDENASVATNAKQALPITTGDSLTFSRESDPRGYPLICRLRGHQPKAAVPPAMKGSCGYDGYPVRAGARRALTKECLDAHC
jgi:hypothetical protein